MATESDFASWQCEKQELEENLRTAASYGKELLETNKRLKSDYEALYYKYKCLRKGHEELPGVAVDLQQKLTIAENNEKKSSEKHLILEEEYSALSDKCESLIKENQDLKRKAEISKREAEDLREEKKGHVREMDDLRAQLGNQRSGMEKWLEQAKTDQDARNASQKSDYLAQIEILQEANAATLAEMRSLEAKHEEKDKDVSQLSETIKELRQKIYWYEEQVEMKECESTALTNAVEKYKNRVRELEETMESMQIVEPDLQKRGNSVFGELDDRRKKVEVAYKSLFDKCDQLRVRNKDLEKINRRLSLKITSLSSEVSQRVDAQLAEKIAFQLEMAQKELRQLKAVDHEVRNKMLAMPIPESVVAGSDSCGYLRVMLEQSRDQLKEMELDKQRLWFKYNTEQDDGRQYRRKLVEFEKLTSRLEEDNLKLKLELQDLMKNDRAICDNADANNEDRSLPCSPEEIFGKIEKISPQNPPKTVVTQKPAAKVTFVKLENDCKQQ